MAKKVSKNSRVERKLDETSKSQVKVISFKKKNGSYKINEVVMHKNDLTGYIETLNQ